LNQVLLAPVRARGQKKADFISKSAFFECVTRFGSTPPRSRQRAKPAALV
jgi:hypothetical protein